MISPDIPDDIIYDINIHAKTTQYFRVTKFHGKRLY